MTDINYAIHLLPWLGFIVTGIIYLVAIGGAWSEHIEETENHKDHAYSKGVLIFGAIYGIPFSLILIIIGIVKLVQIG